MQMAATLAELCNTLPQQGRLTSIGVRPARREPLVAVAEQAVKIGQGLADDRFSGRPDSKRQVTLIQAEHLLGVAAMLGLPTLDPLLTRRNLVVEGINLLALKEARFAVGEVILEGTGPCHPCSRMEEIFGPGGYNAMRGHGGITARVVQEGTIRVGDTVRFLGE